MHDLTLKPGKQTSEWIALVTSLIIQWTAVILTVLTDLAPVIPEKWNPWVLLGVSVLTSLQTVAYSAKRHDLKKAAIESVAGYNTAMAQIETIRGAQGVERKNEGVDLDASTV